MITSDNNIIENLNYYAESYYYSCENRNYVHSTTFLLLAYEVFNAEEITIYLKKSIFSGFYFSKENSIEDLGYIKIEKDIYYIRSNEKSLVNLKNEQISYSQNMLLDLQNFVTSGYYFSRKEKVKLWSRKLIVKPKILFTTDVEKISLDIIHKFKFKIFYVKANDIILWEQHAHQ